LDANDVADAAALRNLSGSNVAKADMAYQALALKIGHDGKGLLERAFGGRVVSEHATQIDDVEHVDTEVT
jgi:hypothetical protein